MTKRNPIPQGVRFDVFRRDEFTCRYCGRSSPEVILHIEHVKPVCAGGKNDQSNYVTACQECNGGKGRKTGVKPPAPSSRRSSSDGLVGKFGHTLDADGKIHWQFEIIGEVRPDVYTIQLYSWLSGCETDQKLFNLKDLADCLLYDSQEIWLAASKKRGEECCRPEPTV